MKITIEPTPERYQAPINGVLVPTRIWRGVTEGGVPMDVYVLTVVPDEGYVEAWKREMPTFMRPARDVMTVNVGQSPDDKPKMSRAEHLHRYGTEPPEE